MPVPQMMPRNIQLSIGLLVTGILFWSSCTLDDQGPGSPSQVLTLSAHQNLSLTELSWNPVRLSGFKEYIILQSSDEIAPLPTPVTSANVSVLKRIDDVDVTSFEASEILFTPRICYKLYASVDDRFIQSQNICIDQNFTLIEGFYDRAGHGGDVDEMIMFDRVSDKLSSFDYKEGVLTKTVTDIVLNFPIINVSTTEGTTNVFAYDQSPPRLRKYRYPELTSTTFKDFSGVLFAVEVYNQFVFVATEEGGKAFQVLNRSNLSVIDTEPGQLGSRNLAVFPGDPLIVMDISESGIDRYSIDGTGKAIFLDNKFPGISQPTTQSGTATGSQYFIGGRLGSIIDKNGTIIGSLSTNFNAAILISRFSADETKVCYIINDLVSFRLEVVDVTNTSLFEKLASYTLPSANFADVIIEDNIIYVSGVSFASGSAQTFVIKFPMP